MPMIPYTSAAEDALTLLVEFHKVAPGTLTSANQDAILNIAEALAEAYHITSEDIALASGEDISPL